MPRSRSITLGLALFLLALPLCAQQGRWQQLSDRFQALYHLGDYAQAIPLAQERVRAAETSFGPEDPRLVASLNDLGRACWRAGQYPDSEAAYQRALALAAKAQGPDSLPAAVPLNGLALLYRDQGKLQDAERLAQRALAIRQKALPPGDLLLGEAIQTLATVYHFQNRYREAEALYQQAARLQEAKPQAGPALAESLNDLAGLYLGEGRYAQAEPLFQRGLQLREKAFPPEHPLVAESLNNLALLYFYEGKYAQAESLYQRALAIDVKKLGPDHPDVARDLDNMAQPYDLEGKYAQAEPLFQRALRIREKALGPEHPLVAISLSNLGLLYVDVGKYAQAEPLLQRALSIYEKALGAENPSLATPLNSLALLYLDEGKYTQAEPLAHRAVRLDEQAGDPNLAYHLNTLALLYKTEGKYDQAAPLYQRDLGLWEKLLGPDHPEVGTLSGNLADLRFAQGLPQQALPLYARCFDLLFRQFQYQFTYLSEKERLGFLATVSRRFPVFFSFVHQFHPQMPELAGDMYNLLLWEKGFIASSETALRRQVEVSGDPQALTLLDQMAAKRAQLAALINQQPQDPQAWRKQIEQLEAEANDLEKALVTRSSAFAQQKKLERVTWQQVRDALKPGEAAVEFARFPFYDGKQWTDKTYYVALVITHETKDRPAYIVLGEGKELEGKPLVQFQQQVQARGMQATASALPGAQAYDLFWKPLEPALTGVHRIYLSPDGVLNQMSLGLIPAPDGKLLMQQYDLRLVSSTKDLLRPIGASSSKTAVLVGDPNFELDPTQYRAALGKLSAPQSAASVAVALLAPTERSRDQGSGAELPPLPGTGAEIQALDRLLELHRWKVAAYTGDRALEEAVKQARSPRVLHIATHGFFLADQQIKTERMGLGAQEPSGLEDPMLRSGLYFAGANRALAGRQNPEDLDDGVLTAYEATGLDLQGTELVVLSACNTGQGEVKNGEGVFGLRRALQEAGAQAVMMSLWSVPDKETQELMALFYKKWLGGMEKHEALRQAQLAEREVVKKRYGRDLPYYWGAFVLVGR